MLIEPVLPVVVSPGFYPIRRRNTDGCQVESCGSNLDVAGDGKPELLATAPWEDGSLQSGVLFVLNTALAGDSLTVSGARTLGRGALGAGSHFGPATPIAGGAVIQLESNEVPIG
jgi:hypothetical protein